MKTNYFIILLIIIGSLKITAQQSIKGYIKSSENNEPLAGVVAYIPNINKATLSDAKGYFEFNNIRQGTYLIEFKLLGYKTISKKVIIQENTDNILHIVLSPSAREIDEVVVTTALDVTPYKDNPMPVKSINFDKINENASDNIIEAIGRKNNVWALSTGPGIAKPVIRGLGYNRTMVLVNGLRQEGQQWGDEHGTEIDQYSIQKAEIIKGPGSIMYGSDALAGVINFIPYKIQNDGFHGKYLGLYQDNNKMFANSIILQYRKNDIGFYIQATQKDASNYQNKIDGKVFNTGFNERNISTALQIDKNWGYTHFFASAFTQKLNMPEGDRDSTGHFIKFIKINDTTIGKVPVSQTDLNSYHFNIPYQYIQHYRFQNYSVFNLRDNSRIISNIGYQYNIRNEFGPEKLLEKHSDSDKDKIGNLSMHLHTIPFQIKYLKTIDSTQMLSIGTTGMEQIHINKGEELLIPDYQLLDAGAFVFYQKTLNKWAFAGGLRFDIRNINTKNMYLDSTGLPSETSSLPPNGSIKFNALSKTYYNISGTTGLVYNGWKNWTLRFNIARGFRAPNLSELASNGAHEGTIRYEYGNNQLKPEVSHQIDAGLAYNGEHLLFEITPFANYINNYIYYRKLSSVLGGDSIITKDGENLWAFTYNQGKALIYGGEAGIDIHPHPLDWLHIESNFSYLKGSMLNQTDSTKYLPFFPPSRWVNEIRTEWNNLNKSLKQLFIKIEAVYVFPQNHFFKAYNTETFTPDYTLLNTAAGIKFKYWKDKNIQLIVGVNNLLDEAYQDHLNRLKYTPPNPMTGKGLYNMGRNIFVRLILDF